MLINTFLRKHNYLPISIISSKSSELLGYMTIERINVISNKNTFSLNTMMSILYIIEMLAVFKYRCCTMLWLKYLSSFVCIYVSAVLSLTAVSLLSHVSRR